MAEQKRTRQPNGASSIYFGKDGKWHGRLTVLLILGVPDVVIDSIMGWEPGGATRMRARYMHVTGVMLRKVAQQVGDALWKPPGSEEKTDRDGN
ncbi:hypothetical protein ACFY2T_24095 [Streptomyces sp. NPDC001260]|uniref:hypothetical protein n=1 Tax=Streptomyces sp. NPDC001260 TaxID=3364551 RepID=UPI0036CD7EC4